jgi:hypothetical protein
MTEPRPPAQLEPYIRVLGTDLAMQFFLHFGGATLYLAANPKGRAMVSRLLSDDQVRALAAEHLPARVPTAKPWIARMLNAQGLSGAEIARRLHTSDVTVRKYLANTDATPTDDPRQARLF